MNLLTTCYGLTRSHLQWKDSVSMLSTATASATLRALSNKHIKQLLFYIIQHATRESWTYDQKVVGSTSCWVAIKWLLCGIVDR